MVGGLSVPVWRVLWTACHAVTGIGVLRHGWPDEGGVLEQAAVTLVMFAVVEGELTKELARGNR